MIRKNRKLSIRVSEHELQGIKDKAKQAGMNLTDYVVKCCLRKQITVIPDLGDILKEQKAIGRNLNQLTTLANMGRIQTVGLADLTERHAAVNQALTDVLERRRWSE